MANSILPLLKKPRPRPQVRQDGLRPPEAARYLGISRSTLDRLNQAGLVPKPLRLGCALIRNRRELARWLDAGSPDRATWEAMKAAAGTNQRRGK
jgi:predicted DNA-binding transcriptional regulator AlpA